MTNSSLNESTRVMNFNSFDSFITKETIANPYPLYHQLRIYDPVLKAKAPKDWFSNDVWILTKHKDISNFLKNNDFRKNFEIITTESISSTNIRQKSFLYLDPPYLDSIRGLINKAFTPRMVNQLRPHIEEIVEDLFKDFQNKGHFELLNDFSYPLPVIVIAELLGVPKEDRFKFKDWSRKLARTIDIVPFSPEELSKIFQASGEMWMYFKKLVDQKKKHPADDLISLLNAVEEQGDKLTEEELISNCILLLIAGHETTMNLIGNGILALLKHPDQLSLLQSQPNLIENAVEELLRYDSPVQLTIRVSHIDTTIGNKKISKGEFIACLLGAGNHDPEVFKDPDRLDITRKDIKHLSFGQGIHFCLGAPLARLEGRVAFKMLLDRFPNLKLKSEHITYRNSFTLRGLQQL